MTAKTLRRQRTIERQKQHSKQAKQWKIYCDLDGVLVDFESGIRRLFPDYDALVSPQKNRACFDIQALPRHILWKRVAADGDFFRDLPWISDGKFLWHNVLKHLNVDILTGVPGYDASRAEKFDWCQRELGVHVRHLDVCKEYVHCVNPDVELSKVVRQVRGAAPASCNDDVPIHNVITCFSDQKFYASGPNAILIDDRESLRPAWEARGGIFVHHINLEYTLEQLSWYGIWSGEDNDAPSTVGEQDDDVDPAEELNPNFVYFS